MTEKVESKINEIEKKIKGLTREVLRLRVGTDEFREATAELFDLQREKFERGLGASMEDFKHQMKLLAEAFDMKMERYERYQKEFNNMIESKVNKLILSSKSVK
jgi:hypothetical protein